MFLYYAPWPGDFEYLEGVCLPDRSEGVASVRDGGRVPPGGLEITRNEYGTRRAEMLTRIANWPRPPDPNAEEIALIRGILSQADAEIDDAEFKQLTLLYLRRLLKRRMV